MRPGGLPMTQKQSNRVLNGLVTRPLSKRNWNSKNHSSFQLSRHSAQIINTRGENSKCRIL
jgi:hypothetical protein